MKNDSKNLSQSCLLYLCKVQQYLQGTSVTGSCAFCLGTGHRFFSWDTHQLRQQYLWPGTGKVHVKSLAAISYRLPSPKPKAHRQLIRFLQYLQFHLSTFLLQHFTKEFLTCFGGDKEIIFKESSGLNLEMTHTDLCKYKSPFIHICHLVKF